MAAPVSLDGLSQKQLEELVKAAEAKLKAKKAEEAKGSELKKSVSSGKLPHVLDHDEWEVRRRVAIRQSQTRALGDMARSSCTVQ